MKENLSNHYKNEFQKVLKPLGFLLFKKTFYRMTNDVLQMLMLRRTETDCTVDFAIQPLVLPIDSLSCEGYNISQLRKGSMKEWDWVFEPSTLRRQNSGGAYETIVFNDGSIIDIINDMLSVVVSHVIPIFGKGIDCESALNEISNYEASEYDAKTCAAYNAGRYMWYIKLGDYEKAILGLNVILKQLHYNEYSRLHQRRIRERRLQCIRLDHEIGMSDNYEKTKLEVLSRENVDTDYKNNLLSRDIYFKNYKTSRFSTIAMNNISMLDYEIAQLMKDNSAMSSDLKKLESEVETRRCQKIDYYTNLIERLSVPDTDYISGLVARNESESLAFLNQPTKRQSRGNRDVAT